MRAAVTPTIDHLDRSTVVRLLSPAECVAAIRSALMAGYRPESDHARVADPLENGEFLLMPSETRDAVGVKVLTVAPRNPSLGLPRIQGVYLLFDRESLAPRMLIDGPALTDLRTAAVSVTAVRDALLDSDAPLDVVVYGAGHQGVSHSRTVRAVLDGRRGIRSVSAVVRDPSGVADASEFDRVLRAGGEEAAAATAAAGLIVCATTARSPLFDGAMVRDDAVVIAVGSHEPDARELDAALLGRSDVIVEDEEVALRECGDVVMAIAEGALTAAELHPMADVVAGRARLHGDRPVVFKSAGMPWQDLVVAAAIAGAFEAQRGVAR